MAIRTRPRKCLSSSRINLRIISRPLQQDLESGVYVQAIAMTTNGKEATKKREREGDMYGAITEMMSHSKGGKAEELHLPMDRII